MHSNIPQAKPNAAQPALVSGYHTSTVASTSTRSVTQAFTKADLTVWGMTLKVMRDEGWEEGLRIWEVMKRSQGTEKLSKL